MLNLLPALIFFLVQGSGDPESLRFRENTIRFLIVQTQVRHEKIDVASWVGPRKAEVTAENSSTQNEPAHFVPSTSRKLERNGVGTSAIPRDGPPATLA